MTHPGGNPGANSGSMSHRYHLREVAFEWELTKETIYLPRVVHPLSYLRERIHPPASRTALSGDSPPALSHLTLALSDLTPALYHLTLALSDRTPALSDLTPALSDLTLALCESANQSETACQLVPFCQRKLLDSWGILVMAQRPSSDFFLASSSLLSLQALEVP